jgi:hypothetical protein
MAIAETRRDVKEMSLVVRQSATAADVERGSYSTLTAVDPEAYLSSQRTNDERN